MAQFCPNCGKKLQEGSRFCSFCGQTISNDEKAKGDLVDTVRTCPNCGEPIKAFSVSCPACGYEFQKMTSSAGVAQFTRQLEEIEKKRPIATTVSKIAGALSGSMSKTDLEKLNLIRNFSIPNTKEDIYEFFVLASSNLNPSDLASNANKLSKEFGEAWLSKFEQAYQKAKATFSGDPLFDNIDSIYKQKKKAVTFQKSKLFLGFVAYVLFMLLLMFLLKFVF